MNIQELVEIKHMEIKEDTIIHYPEIRALCSNKSVKYPNGCPSLEKCKKHDIPPFEDIYKYYYVVYGVFDREGYRQVIGKNDNTRWWQTTYKNILRDYIEELSSYNPPFYVYSSGSGTKFSFQFACSMEWGCIHVFRTMRLNGVKLDLNPVNRVVLCNLLCSKKKIQFKNGKQTTLEGFK